LFALDIILSPLSGNQLSYTDKLAYMSY